tara:strand:+ start:529 stop:1575 length:1047 start_codon:yes stop_codon:yes gene_type:complete
MPFCRQCGKEVESDWKICPFCGEPQDIGNDKSESPSPLQFQDSAMSGDIHHTVINNDVDAVTNAVIMALDKLGVVSNDSAREVPVELVAPEIQRLSVGDAVDYFSPTNERWLDNCTVTEVNEDGTYVVSVPKSSRTETKYAVSIGDSPGCIRPSQPLFTIGNRVLSNWKNAGPLYFGTIADLNPDGTYDIQYDDGDAELRVEQSRIHLAPNLSVGDRVFVNWKAHGYYFPAYVAAIHPDHTIRVDYDDGDKEDNVPLSRVRVITEENTEVMEYADAISESEEELLQAFRVFDTQETGTISATELFRILTEMGDQPIDQSEVFELFNDLEIEMDAELDYRQLAKWLVSP